MFDRYTIILRYYGRYYGSHRNRQKDNSKIKLIAKAKKTDKGIEYSVQPTKLSNDHSLASVSNEFNAVFVTGNAVGELMFYGKGAGSLPTGSAVMGDIIEIAKRI